MLRIFCLFLLCLSSLAPRPAASELVSTPADQVAVAVTIYNRDLALIRDTREVSLAPGRQLLAFREVSARIQPQTALLAGPGMQVLEQDFEYDLLSSESLLEKYVDREVMLVKTHPTTGEERLEKAVVLSVDGGVVLRVGDHIESGVPGRLVYPDVPEDLRDRPTLTMLVDNQDGKPQQAVLSYLTGGLSWQADYVAELSADDTSIDLSGWVSLKNESGISYRDAELKLVAGDVHRVSSQIQERRKSGRLVVAEGFPAAAVAAESMFEYHLYSLARPTTIRHKQSKQVALMHAAGVQVQKEFVLQGREHYYRSRVGTVGRKMKVGVFVELKNSRQAGLGQPLPAGVVRVYKKDGSGRLQFVGEDRIGHSPDNETIRLRLGNAFEVTAVRRQLDFKKLAGFSRYNYVFESAFEIELKNGKEEAVQVRVAEPVPGDWQIIEESAVHQKETSGIAVWQLQVAPKSSTILTYRVQVRY
jgi:hypothetical protein